MQFALDIIPALDHCYDMTTSVTPSMNRLTAITLFVSFMGMALGAILHSRGVCCLSLGFILGHLLYRVSMRR